MKQNEPHRPASYSLFPFLSRLSAGKYFILIFILETALAFQGLDLSDEGFLSIFYQRIFSDPSSVSYNFMFWLTGIIGGIWVKIFSPLGLWGIRLAGAIVNALTTILTYHLLRHYLNRDNLKLGLLLVVLSLNNDIKVLNYNTLSSLFYLIIILLLFSGLKQNQWRKIFLAGLFAGLNVFIRIPNILELGFILGIMYYHYPANPFGKKALRQIILFLAGFLTGISAAVIIMYLIGHLPVFLDSINLLHEMSKGVRSDPGKDLGGYGLFRLLNLFRSNMIQSLKYALIVLVFISGLLYLIGKSRTFSKFFQSATKVIVYLSVAAVFFLILNHRIDHFTFLFFLNGAILLAAILLFSAPVDRDIKTLLFFGCFFLLSFPLGSGNGIYSAGRYCLWIALPITLDYLLGIRSFSNILTIYKSEEGYSRGLRVAEGQLTITKKLLMGIAVFAGFYYLFCYPFFDRKNRLEMHYALQSRNLKGIYTTKKRAEIFNELLRASAKYLKPNDYAIAYDRIAMFYYATNTIPMLTNSLPAVYSPEMFRADLRISIEKHKILPPVIVQKIATTGDASKWPEEIVPENSISNELDAEKNNILDSFLVRNNYKEVWSNLAFKILIPEK
jgi:hypothetical protein